MLRIKINYILSMMLISIIIKTEIPAVECTRVKAIGDKKHNECMTLVLKRHLQYYAVFLSDAKISNLYTLDKSFTVPQFTKKTKLMLKQIIKILKGHFRNLD